MQNGVGRAAHGNVERHGVFKRVFGGNIAWQHRSIVLLIIAFGQIDYATASFQEQFFAESMGGQQRTIAWQRQAQGFGQAVHGVGGKHA